jgi:hypothetical protein
MCVKLILLWSLLWVLQEIWIFAIKYAEMLIIYIVYMYSNVIAFSILSHGLRRGSILAWIVILSVYHTDIIAIDLSLSPRISWFMKSIINYNLHAIISTLILINLHWDKTKLFCCISRNLQQCWSATNQLHALSLLQKTFNSEINSFCKWTMVGAWKGNKIMRNSQQR